MNPDNVVLRLLFFPLALLFGLAVSIKNGLYQAGLFNGVKFNIPVVSVGNLSVGGAGKTPHVEYLVRLLRSHVRTAVMSRGFGRKTTGFMHVEPSHESEAVGDEPLIFARKYRDVHVAVSESRSIGIPLLLQQHPQIEVILLDDAYQHRSVTPHINILLTEYDAPFFNDWLMPSGSLREWPSGYDRADIIIMSKCPITLNLVERERILSQLKALPHQRIFFSFYHYHHPYSMYPSGRRVELVDSVSVLLVCGIAKTDYLVSYVEPRVGNLDVLKFKDHHDFQQGDMDMISSRFQHLPGANKFILTTEKDAVRLETFAEYITTQALPFYILPVAVGFLFDEGPQFDDLVRDKLLEFKI